MSFFNTKFLSAAGLSAALFVTSFVPVQAMVPIPVAKPAVTTTSAEPVQYRDRDGYRGRDSREDWRRRGMNRRGDSVYYNGHRGYRERRRGYREYNGMWFPLAAFATGAIIGGAVNRDRPARVSGSHVSWCQQRYRSYRVSDNTYQPNNGPRVQCNSPY
jgi:hypothetical protein